MQIYDVAGLASAPASRITMFIRHFAVALAAKRAVPTVSLGMLFLAAQLADLVWPNLVLAGIEHVAIDPGNTAYTPLAFVAYPYSHSLVGMTLWGLIAGLTYAWLRHAMPRTAGILALVVVSHWVLDVVSHRPDMPLTFADTTHVGLGLWNSVPDTVVVEALMLAVGLTLYVRTTRARDRIGSVGFWSLVGFLMAINVANVVGPPPPRAGGVAGAAQAMWLLVVWGAWVDRHRVPMSAGGGQPAGRARR
jgi:hypothetical protein